MAESTKQTFRGHPNYRRRIEQPKQELPKFPVVPFPTASTLTVKHIGFLHGHRKLEVWEIAAMYAGHITHAEVHNGIHHYLKNQKAIDEEIIREAEFNVGSSLKDASMRLPSVGLTSLVDARRIEETYKAPPPRRKG